MASWCARDRLRAAAHKDTRSRLLLAALHDSGVKEHGLDNVSCFSTNAPDGECSPSPRPGGALSPQPPQASSHLRRCLPVLPTPDWLCGPLPAIVEGGMREDIACTAIKKPPARHRRPPARPYRARRVCHR